MNFFNSKAYLAGLCVFFACLSPEAFAVPQQKITKQDIQKAYTTLVQKSQRSHAQIKNKRQNISLEHQKRQKRYKAIQVAKRQIRKKYRWGGKSPRTGFDCSGLTQYAYKSAKINIPRTANAQYKSTKRIPLAKAQVGDLIFFRTRRTRQRVNHVGIYLGQGKFIHAPRRGKRVSVSNLNKYWRRKVIGAGRV